MLMAVELVGMVIDPFIMSLSEETIIIKGQLLNDCHQYLLALLHFFFLTIAICSFLVLL